MDQRINDLINKHTVGDLRFPLESVPMNGFVQACIDEH